MTTGFIPGTMVKATIIDPAQPKGLIPLFWGSADKGDGEMMSSVNAGTSNTGSVFAVGLGGINGAFDRTLRKAGQKTDHYQAIHQALYTQVGDDLSGAQTKFDEEAPIRFSLIQKPEPDFKLPDYEGIVFVDVFKPDLVPNGNALNCSMLYLVPPDSSNYKDESSFLSAIEASCKTIIAAIELYNTVYAKADNYLELSRISILRICLFSGGIYRGYASQDHVATSNLKGLAAALTKETTLSGIEFENSYDDTTGQYVFQAIKNSLE